MESNAKRSSLGRVLKNPNTILLIFGIIIIAVIAVFVPSFRTWRNITSLVVQASSIGIMAIGLTFVIITSGNDLSLPTTMTLAAILGCIVMRNTQSVLLGTLVTIVFGAVIGALWLDLKWCQ